LILLNLKNEKITWVACPFFEKPFLKWLPCIRVQYINQCKNGGPGTSYRVFVKRSYVIDSPKNQYNMNMLAGWSLQAK